MYYLKDLFNLSKIGNKSKNLSILKKAGYNIPDGFIIENLNEFNIEEILNEVNNNTLYAIRSSALGEDGSENSFAGVFKSIINVTKENFLLSIKEVEDSFFGRKSIVYQKIKKVKIIPQILIQEMVQAKYSVVIFSNNFTTNFSLIEGECEKIVSGKFNSNEYNYKNENINSFIEDFNINDSRNINLNFLLIEIDNIKNILNLNFGVDIEAVYDGEIWHIIQVRALIAD